MSHLKRAGKITGQFLVMAVVAMALAGCPPGVPLVQDSVSIIDLDKELMALYGEKLAASADAQAGTNTKLASVATRAAQQGDKVSAAGDLSSAVSFYRIASTADWAAGPPHNRNVPDLGRRGADACARLPNPDAQRSRDCTLAKMVENLALLDVKADEAEKLLKAGPKIPPGSFDSAVALSQDVSGQMQEVLRKLAAAGPQADSFEEYLGATLNTNYCTLGFLLGALDKSSAPAASVAAARKALRDAQAPMQAARMPMTCPS